MTSRFVPVLGLSGLIGVLVGARVALRPLAPVTVPDVAQAPAALADSAAPVVADSVGAQLVARDPFRLGRRPSSVAYDPLRLAQQGSAPPPRPPLVLVGVVAGKDPTAVIQGLPGTDGVRVLRVGDVVGGIKLRRMKSDSVWLAGLDTTWALGLRKP